MDEYGHHVWAGISEIEYGNPRGIKSAVGRVFSVSTMKSGDQQGSPPNRVNCSRTGERTEFTR